MRTVAPKIFKPAEPIDGELIPLHQRPEYVEQREELEALEKLHSQKERERQRLLAKNRGEKTKRTAAERAADLLNGGFVDPVPAPDRLAAIDEELGILRSAIGEKTRALDVIASDLSHTECLRAKPQFDAAMVRAFEGLETAVAEFAEAESVANRLRAAGYRVSSVVMPDLQPAGIAGLRMNGLQTFRRALAEMGAL